MTEAYSYRILRHVGEAEKQEWRELWHESSFHHFFNALEFFEAYCQVTRPTRVAVIFCYQGKALQAVLPLVREWLFGIRTYVTPGKNGNYTDKFPLLIKTLNHEVLSGLLERALSLGNVFLAEVEEALVAPLQLTGHRRITEWASASRFVALAPELDVLRFMSARQRRNLRKRIEQRHDDLRLIIHETQLEEAFQTVLAVERGSYKQRRHTALFQNQRTIALFESLIKRCPERLRIGVLSYQGQPVATKLGLVHDGVFCFYHSAFLETCGHWGAGKMIQCLTFDYLKEHGFTKADLLRGDSEVKRQFAEEVSIRYNLLFPQNVLVTLWWQGCLPVRNRLKQCKARLLDPCCRWSFGREVFRDVPFRVLRSISRVSEPLACFLHWPKNFLFLFSYSTKRHVTIKPFTEQALGLSIALKQKIQQAGLDMPMHFIGSCQLRIAGQRDIDIFLECAPADFEERALRLRPLFGAELKKHQSFREWFFDQEGFAVEIVLIDPQSEKFRDQMATFQLLKKNKEATRAYEQMKLSAQGVSEREYQKRKLLFFHRLYLKYHA